ncbi:MAG: hypothetical protein ACM3TT_05250 [Syntrophothermus sp.]
MKKKTAYIHSPEIMESDKTQNSIGLLISILVRYPEVGTIKYEPEQKALKFTFILNKRLASERFKSFTKKLEESLSALAVVTQRVLAVLAVERFDYKQFTLIEVKRDVESLSQEEISLLSNLARDYFGNSLVMEGNELIQEEDQLLQEELIDHMLEDIKENLVEKDLIGFREEGRVFVFNKTNAWRDPKN